MARKTGESKTENKTVTLEKPSKLDKALSKKSKNDLEKDHLLGKHKDSFGDCGYCNRRSLRDMRKAEKTRRFYASKK